METAQHGSVFGATIGQLSIVGFNVTPDAPPSKEPLKMGWSPYTQFQCFGASGIYSGQMMTFSSSSWGGRRAFHYLIHPYIAKAQTRISHLHAWIEAEEK